MQFNVDASLKQAVEQFSWEEQVENTILPIPVDDANTVANEVTDKIIAASDIRPTMEMMAKKTMSLKEVCYLVVQSQDSKLANPVTLTRIQQVTQDEKTILNHVFKKLSEMFVQVESNDLKAITLLFGIHRISEVAARNIPDLPQLTPDQESQANLTQLIEMRNQYDFNSVPVAQRDFLVKVDEQIGKK